jgi:formylglycine-generating enzyme required for sulfatase activity
MASRDSEKNTKLNLIFGSIGLRLGLLTKAQIIKAFTEWLFDKRISLSKILIQHNSISEDQEKKITEEVQSYIKEQGSEDKAFESLPQVKNIENYLNHLADQDLQNTLNTVILKRKKTDLENLKQTHLVEKININLPKLEKEDESGDRFLREAFLDSGNLGEVYLARDTELNRTVVSKYIKPEWSGNDLVRALFHLEGEVTGSLEHPGIVPVYGLGKDAKGLDFFAMRYIRGRKLSKIIQEFHSLSIFEQNKQKSIFIDLLQYFESVCMTIEFAHNKGVLHCDIKPDNIMIGDYGEVFVVDWGLVVVQGKVEASDDIHQMKTLEPGAISQYKPSGNASSGLHEQQGGSRKSVGGTPAYMAPEQLKATMKEDISLVTAKADIYALGSTLYHIITGRPPHLPKGEGKESPEAFYLRITNGAIPKVKEINPKISNSLQGIVLKAMNLNPLDRYGSARELAEDIKRWVADEPVSAYQESRIEKTKRYIKKYSIQITLGFLSLITIGMFIFVLKVNSLNSKLRESNLIANQRLNEIEQLKIDYTKKIQKAAKEIDAKMVRIEKGRFKMGAGKSEGKDSQKERQHQVIITKPFLLGKYEVTINQWDDVMGTRLSTKQNYNFPITDVSWDACQEFLQKLNEATGEVYRLPTEAEWEYACRAGTNTPYAFGEKISKQNANYEGKLPKKVGSYPPNSWGLYDMHGNVWEWVNDWFGEYPPNGVDIKDPKGPEKGDLHILRGGSFSQHDNSVRSAFRYAPDKVSMHNHGAIGFRLVKEIR